LFIVLSLVLMAGPPVGAARYDKLIKTLMQNENAKVRLKAAKRLGRFKHRTVVDALSFALDDPAGTVRAAAALSLGRLKNPASFGKLCSARRDRDQLVVRAVRQALAGMGGEGACKADKVYVEFDVTGDTDAMRSIVVKGLAGRASQHPRIVIGRELDAESGAEGADPRTEVKAGRMNGVQLKVRVSRVVQKGGGKTLIKCEMSQAVFDMRLQALRGSATQRGAIELGTENVTDKAIDAQLTACMEAITPVVFEGLTDYLARLR
jgi:hypothetical protein